MFHKMENFACSRLTCPEPYFVSEALYCLPEELESTREVDLHVITMGVAIEDSSMVSFDKNPKKVHIAFQKCIKL